MFYPNRSYITPIGFQNLKNKLDNLYDEQAQLGAEFREALEIGRFEENADLDNAKTHQRTLEVRIEQIKNILKAAVLIKKPRYSSEIKAGSTVQVKNSRGTVTYTIVGSLEADPSRGLISLESPLGRALLGAQPGQTVSAGNGRTIEYAVLSVS